MGSQFTVEKARLAADLEDARAEQATLSTSLGQARETVEAKKRKLLEAARMVKSAIEHRKVVERDLQVWTQQVCDLRARLTPASSSALLPATSRTPTQPPSSSIP